ncbi:MAG: exodeoxyribonuclease VII large subunit [Ruminococcaceae bacterium]|nr:exodeoxyribonuclease VII large subunit [Oscillospiraceae bacterium]
MNNDNVLTVTGLNEYIKSKIDSDALLNDVYVRGEISNFTNHKTGHFYLTLKDETGVLRAVMFKAYASRMKFLPENGMKVTAHGRVSLFPRDGQYQLYIDSMEPDGTGSLYLAFEQLKAKLEAEGLFSPVHKKSIPKYPMRVGVITSPTGAAVRDMINISTRRFPAARLILFPCLVQGESAPAQLCSGIRFFNERDPVDVIIIGRGGGSLEELWAFNDERLARAIFASRIPVISAVGHETDFSISDFVSDLRAPTPSAAVELALPETDEIRHRLGIFVSRMASAENAKIKNNRSRLDGLAKKRCFTGPEVFIDDRRMSLFHSARLLESRMNLLYEKKSAAFKRETAKLEALNPLSIISRGYTAVFKEDGELAKSVKQLAPGDKIQFDLTDGHIEARVEKTENK